MGNCLVIQDRKEIKIMSVDGSQVLPDVFPVKAAAASVVDSGAARVKLVISKQELKKMLDKEGMSLDDMVSLMRKEASDREREECCGGWRPALESIPEGRDL
ncbi:hypothetical protein PAHAL_3G029300 [Panicum hallii]|jgi:hypothetical protein|uniref:Uncharacterized protein n=1 Tax=Panicum hallii TaxID=206008 RepID=A0A2S3H5X3_9POAL|nr:uncharacterized protein LOC112886912 [Panicum hallii]PAN16053.1 hypothetical protein PAHAL_3G029300 [Panicum hallii]